MGNDKRLEDLQAELVLLVETSNDEIADLDRRIVALQQERSEKYLSSLEKINMQRGRIAEREAMLAENAPQSHDNGGLSVLQGMQGAIDDERQKEA